MLHFFYAYPLSSSIALSKLLKVIKNRCLSPIQAIFFLRLVKLSLSMYTHCIYKEEYSAN